MSLMKRLADCIVAAVGLIVLSPLLALVAAAISLDSRGPIFFRGARLGKDGAIFHICKFRTMAADAAARGAGITTRNDPRITRVGRVLRRTKIDELPQLWNVLRGEMSLVGPRPEDPRYLPYYSTAQRRVLTVPPGITGAASIAFRHEEDLLTGPAWEEKYIHQILPAKLNLELAYLDRRTFWSDWALVWHTGLALIDRGKIYVSRNLE